MATSNRPPRPRRESGTLARLPRVLVVDDAADERTVYSEALREQGLLVLEAANGLDAVTMASGAPPDLIVMDLSMPVMGGVEAIRRLKAARRTRSIPVVILSGAGLARHWAAKAAGCDAFLVKPCTYEDLVGVVTVLLDEHVPRAAVP
jgi:two-component system cell cycle response regulator DivK